jgi:hypothetical protein
LLPLLGASGQKDHQRFSIAPELDPGAWADVDPVFEHAFADTSQIRQVALPEAGDPYCHFRAH